MESEFMWNIERSKDPKTKHMWRVLDHHGDPICKYTLSKSEAIAFVMRNEAANVHYNDTKDQARRYLGTKSD